MRKTGALVIVVAVGMYKKRKKDNLLLGGKEKRYVRNAPGRSIRVPASAKVFVAIHEPPVDCRER